MLKKMRYHPLKLLEAFYFNTVIPQMTYCISVWGNCSAVRLYEIEKLLNEVDRFIHIVPDDVLKSEVLSYIKWRE